MESNTEKHDYSWYQGEFSRLLYSASFNLSNDELAKLLFSTHIMVLERLRGSYTEMLRLMELGRVYQSKLTQEENIGYIRQVDELMKESKEAKGE